MVQQCGNPPRCGHPSGWENQEKWEGGWERTKSGKLKPKAGSRIKKLATIFHNPKLPGIQDYYEPWSYEYEKLSAPKDQKTQPTAPPISQLDGRRLNKVEWSSNWDDNLGGSTATMDEDPVLSQMNLTVKKDIEDSFMFYLPRICEHCLNPTCVSS